MSLRPRFSLLTVLLLFALFACALTIWQLWREVGPLREEVHRLRDEVGELTVDDPQKLHAIRVDTKNDELTWKWRLWIPEARTYALRSVGGEIPKEGFPGEGGTIWIRDAGEMWVEYRITKDPRSGRWRGAMATTSGSVGSDDHEWVEWSSRSSTGDGVGTSTRSVGPDETLLITRQRFGKDVPSSHAIPDPAPGFMIWIEPRP